MPFLKPAHIIQNQQLKVVKNRFDKYKNTS